MWVIVINNNANNNDYSHDNTGYDSCDDYVNCYYDNSKGKR